MGRGAVGSQHRLCVKYHLSVEMDSERKKNLI